MGKTTTKPAAKPAAKSIKKKKSAESPEAAEATNIVHDFCTAFPVKKGGSVLTLGSIRRLLATVLSKELHKHSTQVANAIIAMSSLTWISSLSGKSQRCGRRALSVILEEEPLARAAETKILRISYCVILTPQPQKWSQNDDLQLAATVTPLVHAIFFHCEQFFVILGSVPPGNSRKKAEKAQKTVRTTPQTVCRPVGPPKHVFLGSGACNKLFAPKKNVAQRVFLAILRVRTVCYAVL